MDKSKDIKVRCYNYSLGTINLLNDLTLSPSTKVIRDQAIRSVTSITANIVESKYSPSKKDFINFRYHSLKSANETLYWLCLVRDMKLIVKTERVTELINEGTEIVKILYTIIRNAKKKKIQSKRNLLPTT